MKRVYALRDTVAMSAGPLMVFPHDAAAIRSFGDVLSDPQALPARHPEHFELICCGHYADAAVSDEKREQAGQLYQCDVPVVVMTGAQWLAAQAPRDKGGES